MNDRYEVKKCPHCGQRLYPVLVPVVSNGTVSNEAYEVRYMDCYCGFGNLTGYCQTSEDRGDDDANRRNI